MKLPTVVVLAITFFVALVSAAPRRNINYNHEVNTSIEEKSRFITKNNDELKKIVQTIGSVGSKSEGGILSKPKNNNKVVQNVNID